MDTHLEKMVDILSDIFLNSVFHADEIERERMVILQEIGMVEDAPEEYVHILAANTFWGDHPLGRSILGTRENITHFKPEVLLDFFHRLYQPERIVVSAAGNLEHERIVDLIGATFEAVKSGDGFPDREAPGARSLVNIHYRDLEQVHLCIGTRGLSIIEPRRYAFSLLNTILGGNMSSRLFQEIRERRGLAYSVYSFISSLFDTGMFGVYAGIDPSHSIETIDLILKEMRTQKEVRVDAGELSDAKEFTKGSLMLASESVDNQMVRLAQNEIHFQKQIPLKVVMEKIESVSEEDIFELTTSIFQPDQLTLTLLGPVSKDNQFEDILIL